MSFAFADLLYEQIEISQTDAAVDPSNLTEYTFSGKSLGAAHSNRKILVAVGSGNANTGRTIDTLTIAGTSATLVSDGVTSARADGGGGAGNTTTTEIWIASLSAGTSGDIVVTWSAGMSRCSIVVYRLINAQTTAYNVATDISITANALTASVNQIGFGVVIGSIYDVDAATRTHTWDVLTEDVDQEVEAGRAHSTASMRTGFSQSAVSHTVTASDTIATAGLIVVSFKPL